MSLKEDFFQDLEALSDQEEDDDLNTREELKDDQSNSLSRVIHREDFLQHLEHIKQETEDKEVTQELIRRSNEFITMLEGQFSERLYRRVRELYFLYFPELESILTSPKDFLAVVSRLGCRRRHDQFTEMSLKDLVPNVIEMNIKMNAASTAGRMLEEAEASCLESTIAEAREVQKFRDQLLEYLEAQMRVIAPNVQAFLESANLTARLVAAAGGIKALAETPSGNIEVMGAIKRDAGGLSTQHAKLHRGIIAECNLVSSTPHDHQRQMARMVSCKIALAARVDAFGNKPNGSEGKKLREKVLERYTKITESAPPRAKRPLPVPLEKASTKRAGKRITSRKKKYQQTELRKWENRVKFGEEGQEQFRGTGRTFGMLGSAGGSNKMKITAQKNQKILKKMKPSSDALSGMQSNLTVTQHQGIELINPEQRKTSGTSERYFGEKSGFATVLQNKLMGPNAK